MRKVLTSFGLGYHQKLLSVSMPTLYKYAHMHNYDLFIPNVSLFPENIQHIPHSWWKLFLFQYLFTSYESILWLDADVLICKFDKDIADEISPDKHFGLVVHHTGEGAVPNCGVWYLNRPCTSWIMELYNYQDLPKSYCWWEQAALIHFLTNNSNTNIPWTEINYEWNPHINDSRKIPEEARFFHSTCFPDRLDAMTNKLKTLDLNG